MTKDKGSPRPATAAPTAITRISNVLRKYSSFFPYNPLRFWQRTSAKFLQDPWQHRIFPQHRWLITQIKRLRPKSILEAGCGFGRNLKFLQSTRTQLFGVDINPSFLHLISGIPVVQADASRLPFADSTFELTFTHGLLMHVQPQHLHKVLGELIRVTRRHLILIEEVRSRPRKINYFTFAHDYRRILCDFPVKIASARIDSLQLMRLLIKL